MDGFKMFFPLPNNQIFLLLGLKAFADDKKRCNSIAEICVGMAYKHCGKTFSAFPKMFSKGFFFRVNRLCGKELKSFLHLGFSNSGLFFLPIERQFPLLAWLFPETPGVLL